MMDTTRRYPRSLKEAFRNWPENCMGVEKPIQCKRPPIWWRLWQVIRSIVK